MSLRRVMDELEEELYGSEESEVKPPLAAIDALIQGIEGKALLDLLKTHKGESTRVFRGFTVGAKAFANPVVRRRLAEEMENRDALRSELLRSWREHSPDLSNEVAGSSVETLREGLPGLVDRWGAGALWLTLAGDTRKTAVRLLRSRGIDWAQAAPTAAAEAKPNRTDAPAAPPAPPAATPKPDPALTAELEALRAQAAALQKQATRSQSAEAQARNETKKLQRECAAARSEAARLQAQSDQLTHRLARFERQRDKLTAENESLQRQLRRLRKDLPQALQKPVPPADTVVVAPPASSPKPARRAGRSRVPGLVWQEGANRHSIPIEEIIKAVHASNSNLVREWADSLRRVARQDRDRFEQLRDEISRESPYCAHVLTRSTQGVIVDGSNVCHYEHDRNGKAKLANLLSAREELRERRFFPIMIQVDASLPYQIDEPGKLAELLERGEVHMVAAGTSADDQITRLARDLGHYVVTNDRGLTAAIDPELELPVITYSIEQGYFYCHEA